MALVPRTDRRPCYCGCGELAAIGGYAARCYHRKRRKGDLDTRPRSSVRPITCTVPGCIRPWFSRGVCSACYRKVYVRFTLDMPGVTDG